MRYGHYDNEAGNVVQDISYLTIDDKVTFSTEIANLQEFMVFRYELLQLP